MNAIRKLLGFALVAAVAAFALPCLGATQNKHFSLLMAVGTPDNTQTDTVVTATFTNDNPSGSSAQISSFVLSVANVSGIAISSATADPAFGGSVSVSQNGTSVSVTGMSTVKATQSYVLTLHVAGCGDRNTWSATVWSGNNFNGGTYFDDSPAGQNATNVPCGVLACNGIIGGSSVSDLINPSIGSYFSHRGPYNEDGTCADAVNYYVSEFASSSTSTYLHFRWANNQTGAAFFYILNQPLGTNPLFGWKATSSDDITASPIFVGPAQQCDQGSLAQFPASYGKLLSDNGGRTIKVDTTTHIAVPPAPPFRIALGPKPMEYMTVTRVSGQTWTVTRGAGAIAHQTGMDVMSTPIPALPGGLTCYDSTGTALASCPSGTYAAGAPARMCYVPVPTDPSHTFIFDIGDGYVKGSI
jgi:hypothetical protein